jgi:hypothetical protein
LQHATHLPVGGGTGLAANTLGLSLQPTVRSGLHCRAIGSASSSSSLLASRIGRSFSSPVASSARADEAVRASESAESCSSTGTVLVASGALCA